MPLLARPALLEPILPETTFFKQPSGRCVGFQDMRTNTVKSQLSESIGNQNIDRILSIPHASDGFSELNGKLCDPILRIHMRKQDDP